MNFASYDESTGSPVQVINYNKASYFLRIVTFHCGELFVSVVERNEEIIQKVHEELCFSSLW